ncbi:MAG TPA: GvpL/GvpF family gas vesicle protein [Gemmatimonadaceae bacterium]
MSDRVTYVYGIVPATLDVATAPPGIDGEAVHAERAGALAALVSRVDGAVYAGGVAEARAGDVAWVGPRAVAHDAVLTWASERGGVIPLPMFTLFSDADAVRAMLREREGTLVPVLERVAPAQEYTLRLFRLESLARAALGASDPAVAELERQAAAATPGQRYLLERKLQKERAVALDRASAEAGSSTFAALARCALGAARDPLPTRPDDGEGTAVLVASFLVRRDALDEFRAEVSRIAGELEPRGYRVEFSGPWPPYHFVREPV